MHSSKQELHSRADPGSKSAENAKQHDIDFSSNEEDRSLTERENEAQESLTLRSHMGSHKLTTVKALFASEALIVYRYPEILCPSATQSSYTL